ncbi:MAG TPA: hypothetical protein VGM43_22210 [Bryobacteraceae bacterium]|jgi:hypothetical protein
MPEVHLPDLEDEEKAPASTSHRFRIPKLLLEVLLISAGVFLGLAGEQWRESAHRHELVESALHGFRAELATNRKAIIDHKDYHLALKNSLDALLAAGLKKGPEMHGIEPVHFEHSAWDLAVANGSLANLNQQLAYSLSHAYNRQNSYEQLTQGLVQAMYLRPPNLPENAKPFFASLDIYFDDITDVEPELLTMYDKLLPQIDRELK